MLGALGFVLARNVIKLLVERRRALPFARFRAKLVAAMLGLALVPAVLVLIVGSELIRNSASRWFAPPIDDVLAAAREIASDYYQDTQVQTSRQSVRLARLLSTAGIERGDVATIRARVSPEVASGRSTLVEVYRILQGTNPLEVMPLFDVASPTVPRDVPRASADRLAARVAAGSADTRVIEPLGSGGELIRTASLVRQPDAMEPVGVVIVSEHLSGSLAQHSRRIVEAYEGYQQLRVLRRPIEGVYLSFFLMMTLFILVSATWLGLYTAKRITQADRAAGGGRARDRAGQLRLPHRTGNGRRVRAARGGVQHHGRRARAVARRGAAQEPRGRRSQPVHRDHPEAHRDGRHLARRARPDQHDEQRRGAVARPRPDVAGAIVRGGLLPCRSPAAADDSPGRGAHPRRHGGTRDRARAGRPRPAPGRGGDAAARRGQFRGHGAGVR